MNLKKIKDSVMRGINRRTKSYKIKDSTLNDKELDELKETGLVTVVSMYDQSTFLVDGSNPLAKENLLGDDAVRNAYDETTTSKESYDEWVDNLPNSYFLLYVKEEGVSFREFPSKEEALKNV